MEIAAGLVLLISTLPAMEWPNSPDILCPPISTFMESGLLQLCATCYTLVRTIPRPKDVGYVT